MPLTQSEKDQIAQLCWLHIYGNFHLLKGNLCIGIVGAWHDHSQMRYHFCRNINEEDTLITNLLKRYKFEINRFQGIYVTYSECGVWANCIVRVVIYKWLLFSDQIYGNHCTIVEQRLSSLNQIVNGWSPSIQETVISAPSE